LSHQGELQTNADEPVEDYSAEYTVATS